MKLGDFFTSAATCRPVNPKKIQFTATARGAFLPDGSKNPSPGGFVSATVTAAMIFVTADEVAEIRLETARRVRDRYKPQGKDDLPPLPAQTDYDLEQMYQTLQRALREADDADGGLVAGGPLFHDASAMQKLVVLTEATRLMEAYNAYVKSEHPEGGVDKTTFRGDEGRGG